MNAIEKLDRIILIAGDLKATIEEVPLDADGEEVLIATLDDAQVTMEGLDDLFFDDDHFDDEDDDNG